MSTIQSGVNPTAEPKETGIKPIQITPGSPWENGDNERFNGRLRREGLNAEGVNTTRQAQIVINQGLGISPCKS